LPPLGCSFPDIDLDAIAQRKGGPSAAPRR